MTLTSAPVSRPSIASKALRGMILAYQAVTAGRSPACRFVPSCSGYAVEAIQRFGVRRATPMVIRRLGRCRPGGPFGFDPVPDLASPVGTSAEENPS
jgi:putative component of membrane protein insertase Oxa1/YidC/SpoIIIJ protein YidD